MNVVPSNYFENIWTVVTTGSSVISGSFNLTIGCPGDIPDAALVSASSWAVNKTLVEMEASYGSSGLETLISNGTLGITVARLAQIHLQAEIPGSRISNALSGRTTPTSPVTGLNCK